MPLTNFEQFSGIGELTKNAKSRLEWLVIELEARTTKEHAITSGKIFKMTEVKNRFISALGNGEWRITRKGLLGFEVRGMIHFLVEEVGLPICSGQQGYWYTDDPDELEDSAKHHYERANAITRKADALMKTARAMRKPQEKMERLHEPIRTNEKNKMKENNNGSNDKY